jgi:hypothetical protein
VTGPVIAVPGGGIDVDRVAAAVVAVPGVAGLTAGPGGAGTYLPGRRVDGVVVPAPGGPAPARVVVHVVARAGVPVLDLASAVRSAVGTAVPGAPVDVVVEDVLDGAPPGPTA